jgi:predicted nucleic acid-binding protein
VAETAVAELQTHNFRTIPSRELVPVAVAIALNYDRSAYDSLYVALAVATESTFISADERLVNALGGHFPVKWLATVS